MNAAEKIAAHLRPAVEKTGYALWDVRLYKEGGELVLEIEIDRPGGISIDDCRAVNAAVEPAVDAMDPIKDPYSLMVSGAGLVRTVRTDAHLDFAIQSGKPADIKLFTALNGSKKLSGVISAYDAESITVGGNSLPRRQISKININLL